MRTVRDISLHVAIPAAVVTGITWGLASRESRMENEIVRLQEALDEK